MEATVAHKPLHTEWEGVGKIHEASAKRESISGTACFEC